MSDACVAANHDELLKGLADAAGFQEPEQAFDSHIHDAVGRLFAGRKMEDMCDAMHGFFNVVTVFDGTVDILNPLARFEFTIVA
jgi:hypothetical protein